MTSCLVDPFLSRRDFLIGVGGSVALTLTGCGNGTRRPSEPMPSGTDDQSGFEDYTHDGPLGPATLFQHGVASGDPKHDAVIIWTRVSVRTVSRPEIWWEVATDSAFEQLIRQGVVETDESRDYTIKIDVQGLNPETDYYYRWTHQDCAGDHNSQKEGEWEVRTAAGKQAYFEWMPVRDNPADHICRHFEYGDLMKLYMLDTMLGESTAKWNVLGQQVMLGKLPSVSFADALNTDQWEGYPGARRRLLSSLRDNRIENTVVLTGDIHSSWAIDIEDEGDKLAVELGTPGVTSPGITWGADTIEREIRESADHVRYVDVQHSGFVVADFDHDRMQADWFHLNGVDEGEGEVHLAQSFRTRAGENRLEAV